MKIAMCPDRTTCQNEAMIEELREQLAQANAKLATIPWNDLRRVFRAADNDGYRNDEVAFWLEENGVIL